MPTATKAAPISVFTDPSYIEAQANLDASRAEFADAKAELQTAIDKPHFDMEQAVQAILKGENIDTALDNADNAAAVRRASLKIQMLDLKITQQEQDLNTIKGKIAPEVFATIKPELDELKRAFTGHMQQVLQSLVDIDELMHDARDRGVRVTDDQEKGVSVGDDNFGCLFGNAGIRANFRLPRPSQAAAAMECWRAPVLKYQPDLLED